MKLSSLIQKLVCLGISGNQSIETASRIKIINKFNLLCISYSLPYIIFSLTLKFYSPALVFLTGQTIYMASLYCNYKAYYNVGKFLILIATNCSVFYLSLFYGFGSGFHLYYFTSPLIVFSLFDFKEIYKIISGFMLYLISISILIYLNYKGITINDMSPAITGPLYSINVVLALSFCLLLATHFSSFNQKINDLLVSNNIELEKKQALLEAEIVERKNTEIKLQTLLKDKEILLSEMHHRVKNNLAVVSGMLDLQVLMTDEEQIKTILSDSRSRIKSMSLIHEALYKFDNASQIEFSRYICTLAEEIKNTHSSLPYDVDMEFNLDPVNLSVTKAIPCGLLVNEVLTNAFKHAFTGMKEGKITITLRENNNICSLEIADNGRGFPKSQQAPSRSIGMILIDAFSKQLKGKYEFTNDNGTRLKLIFEMEDK